MATDVWVEKYRPRVLDDVVGNKMGIASLKCIAAEGNMPHLLLAGPPGIGKTTSVHALARTLLGDECYKKAVLELNASDERGIDVIRDKIKTFAKQATRVPPGRHKIVVLDEADAMTAAAQQALRRIMEIYSDTTRFALACNDSTRIIDALQSRCTIIRLGRLSPEDIRARVQFVAEKEGVKYTTEGLATLEWTSEGDMRNALNNMQSTANGFGFITKENVLAVCNIPPPEKAASIINHCIKGDWRSAHLLGAELLAQGFSPQDVVAVLKSHLMRADSSNKDTNASLHLQLIVPVIQWKYHVDDSVATPLQLDALLATMCEAASTFAAAAAG